MREGHSKDCSVASHASGELLIVPCGSRCDNQSDWMKNNIDLLVSILLKAETRYESSNQFTVSQQ